MPVFGKSWPELLCLCLLLCTTEVTHRLYEWSAWRLYFPSQWFLQRSRINCFVGFLARGSVSRETLSETLKTIDPGVTVTESKGIMLTTHTTAGLLQVVFGQFEFELQPVNVTALQDSIVQFNATVQGPWTFMTWTMGEFLVLTMPSSGIPTSYGPRYSARLCGTGITCVEFSILNVTRKDSGPVTCTVQGAYGSKTAQLSVQETGSVGISGGGISGGSRTVQQGEQVEFQCAAFGWFPAATISWTLNGYAVNSSLVNTTDVGNENGYNSTSVYKFTAIRNNTVTCLATVPALPDPISSSVQLVVVPKPTDWTVLIAIVLSFSLFALVVLLIIGLIFCYKRRKEKQPTYQAEMMRQQTQSQLSNRPDIQRQGQVNPVFTIDGQTSLPPSEWDSRFSQTNGSFHEQPVSDNSNQAGNGDNPAYSNLELSFPKHRHVTIV